MLQTVRHVFRDIGVTNVKMIVKIHVIPAQPNIPVICANLDTGVVIVKIAAEVVLTIYAAKRKVVLAVV